MNLGEASGIPVINAALSRDLEDSELTVIDCPPGTACSAMESAAYADYCLLVVEPTAFGLHNFQMVYELVTVLEKPCGVIINKADGEYHEVEEFCDEHNIPILCRIPYSPKLASFGASAKVASLQDEETAKLFRKLLDDVKKEARQ
jgi:MinD superfamily P-loop ATPase